MTNIDLNFLFRCYTKAEQHAQECKIEWQGAVEQEKKLDVQCNALRIMLRGIHSLTDEANKKYLGFSLRNKHKHMVQLEPVAMKMYEDCLRIRRKQPDLTRFMKRRYRRHVVDAQRWLSLFNKVEDALVKKFKTMNPDGNWRERDKWIYGQKMRLKIESDLWADPPRHCGD